MNVPATKFDGLCAEAYRSILRVHNQTMLDFPQLESDLWAWFHGFDLEPEYRLLIRGENIGMPDFIVTITLLRNSDGQALITTLSRSTLAVNDRPRL